MWEYSISWTNLQSIRKFYKYKNEIFSNTLFLHFLYFYDIDLNLINTIKFARCKQMNYDYDKFQAYNLKYNNAFLTTSKYYAWFVNIENNQYICLYKSIFTYMFRGYIENNTYYAQEKINYLSYQPKNKKDDLIINFLLNHLQANKLLTKL